MSRGRFGHCKRHRARFRRYGTPLAHVPLDAQPHVVRAAAVAHWRQMLAAAYEPTPAEGHGRLWLV